MIFIKRGITDFLTEKFKVLCQCRRANNAKYKFLIVILFLEYNVLKAQKLCKLIIN